MEWEVWVTSPRHRGAEARPSLLLHHHRHSHTDVHTRNPAQPVRMWSGTLCHACHRNLKSGCRFSRIERVAWCVASPKDNPFPPDPVRQSGHAIDEVSSGETAKQLTIFDTWCLLTLELFVHTFAMPSGKHLVSRRMLCRYALSTAREAVSRKTQAKSYRTPVSSERDLSK